MESPVYHNKSSLLIALVAALLVLSMVSSASAQQVVIDGNTDPNINVQNFEPTPSPYGVFSIDSAQGSANLQVSGGLILNFAKDPLVLVPENGDPQPIVESQLAADVLFALGFFDVLELGLGLPVYLVNSAEVQNADVSGATIGDLILRPKFTILSPEDSPIGFAIYSNIVLPTGDTEAFTSSGTFAFRPGIIVDTKIDRLLLAANLGANLQEAREFGNLKVGSELTYGVGAQYELVPGTFLLGGEIFGSSTFDDFFKTEETPLEGLVGLKYRTGMGLNFELGAGGGLVSGYGSPAFRVLGGVRYANFDNDWDDDGILNNVDACDREPEDRDLFEDEDGCPDEDNDQDNILDKDDSCPNEAEDKDEFEDADGCPDPDNDKDGIADVSDACPNVPGTPEFEGCPTPDKDQDGIMDDVDACPEEPEDKDNFEDSDGCPDPDNDKDGIMDVNDSCPLKAEDKDGWEDEDGCPELDNDGDGIIDSKDKCPNKAEVLNGFKDQDGCPDKGAPIVTPDLKILQRVFFDTGKATIKRRSYPLLEAVALVMKGNPGIKLVQVQGHTDDVGNDASNMKLSQARADSVRKFLIDQGVEPERLNAKGFGETEPSKSIDGLRGRELKAAREKNRRVQFKILKKDNSNVRTE